LGSPRDRDAEAVRQVLRRSGFRDFEDQTLEGFAVEGANASEDGPQPFYVSYCGDTDVAGTMSRYRQALEQAGLQVTADPQDVASLLVSRQPTGAAATVSRPGSALLRIAGACAVLATVGLVASWVGTGNVRLAGGIGSGVLSVTAVFLAALWYRRGLDEDDPGR
jgi:hypothetical protein